MAKSSTKTVTAASTEKLMFAGPNIRELGLSTGTPYIGIPSNVPDDMKFMFLSIADYNAKRGNAKFQRMCAEAVAKLRSGK